MPFPHLVHLQLPKPQLLHFMATVLLPAIHLSHFTQLSFLLPKLQLLHTYAGCLLLPIHLSHFTQLSFLLPKLQLLQIHAGSLPIVSQYNKRPLM